MQQILKQPGDTIKGRVAWKWADVRHLGDDSDSVACFERRKTLIHDMHTNTFLNKLSWDSSQPIAIWTPNIFSVQNSKKPQHLKNTV